MSETSTANRHRFTRMYAKADYERGVSDKFLTPAPSLLASLGQASPLVFSHMRSEATDYFQTKITRPEDAYGVSVFLGSRPVKLRMWMNGRETPVPPIGQGGIVLTHMEAEPMAGFGSGFDFVRCFITRDALDELSRSAHSRPSHGLRRPDFGAPDPVLYHLASAVAPLIARAAPGDQLLLDQLAMAFHSRVSSAYGGAPRDVRESRQAGLAPWQERRAKDFMAAHLGRGVSLEELAGLCGLSSSRFARAFRNSTGRPPHRWLVEQRVEAAKSALIEGQRTLAEIAATCGFADASHFSRVFSRTAGQSPAAWRRGRSRGELSG